MDCKYDLLLISFTFFLSASLSITRSRGHECANGERRFRIHDQSFLGSCPRSAHYTPLSPDFSTVETDRRPEIVLTPKARIHSWWSDPCPQHQRSLHPPSLSLLLSPHHPNLSAPETNGNPAASLITPLTSLSLSLDIVSPHPWASRAQNTSSYSTTSVSRTRYWEFPVERSGRIASLSIRLVRSGDF